MSRKRHSIAHILILITPLLTLRTFSTTEKGQTFNTNLKSQIITVHIRHRQ